MTIALANRLIEYRKKAGLSQEQLADKLGVSRQAVSKWERGESSPDTDNLIELAKLYNVSLDELVGNVVDSESTKKETPDPKESVDIGPGHVHVVDEDGTEVHISFDGVKVKSKDKNINIGKQGIKVGTGLAKLLLALISLFTLIVIIVYVVVGCTYKGTLGSTEVNAWTGLWPLFILIPVPESIVAAIKKKKFCEFNIIFAITATYLFIGMLTNMWHPYWFLFLFIPVYYIIFGLIDRYIHRNKNVIENDID